MANKLSKLTTKGTESDYPMLAMVGGSKPSKEQEMRERRYRAKDALQCLIRAEEIRRDKKLMADVMVCAEEEKQRLQSVRMKKPSGR